jgi:hypothetical protein
MIMNRKRQSIIFLLIILLGGFVVLSLAGMPAAADGDLPPRATMVPTPGTEDTTPVIEAGPPLPSGARLRLDVEFSKAWNWDENPWHDLWTVIQWSDGQGNWYDVDGWRGNLDVVEQKEERWMGQKEWWVAKEDFNTGPFRWLVYQHEGGPLLAMSESFDLPGNTSQTVVVKGALAP